MNQIHLTGNWIIKAPRKKVYEIVSDFEKMPENFPKVAHELKIVKRDGNLLEIDGKAKSFGRIIPVKMKTELLPGKGFISDNKSDFGTSGHEEMRLEDHPEGTKINYSYQVELHTTFLRIVAKPLIGWFGLWFWKKAFIDQLKKMLE